MNQPAYACIAISNRSNVVDPADLVASVATRLECPTDSTEADRFAAIIEALGRQDGVGAAGCFTMPLIQPTGPFPQLSAYTLATLTAECFAVHDVPLAGNTHLLRTIRQMTRTELLRSPSFLPTLWLIPATVEQRTAAHVGALYLTGISQVARPWLWPGYPEDGRFVIVTGSDGEAPIHPAAGHPRCKGTIGLDRLIMPAPEFC